MIQSFLNKVREFHSHKEGTIEKREKKSQTRKLF